MTDHRPGHDPVATVGAMNDALVHRGPDDHGLESSGPTAIAMRRLAIIDLEGGHQPMTSADGRHTVVFNGEIYNYRRLRQELGRRGHRFRTESDTEVVLELYREMGHEAVGRLNGMFAFCVLDRDDGSLFLSRDQFGQKPLFYAHTGDRFVFSSELGSLLEDRSIPRRLDRRALAHYLRLLSVPAPLTMVEGVRQLLPGQWVRIAGDGRLTTGTHRWDGPGSGEPITDDDEAIDAVRDALVDAVERHLVADVPVGCFLSGGIDSTAVVAAAVQRASAQVRTFTVRWEDEEFDESPVARAVARHLGTDHHEIMIAQGGFDPDVFWDVVDHLGQPFVDTSVLPTFLLCREVRQHLTVALSGDGGDELFAGYDDYGQFVAIERAARVVPRPLARAGRRSLDALSTRGPVRDLGALRLARRAARAMEEPPGERTWATYEMMNPAAFADLTGGALAEPDMQPIRALMAGWPTPTPLREMMAYRASFVMPDQMLVKVDRMSMASSLEVRAPMLDRRMGAVADRLADRHLRRKGEGKWAVRRAIEDWVPDIVMRQPKRGFGAPLHTLQNEAYVRLCDELILDPDHAVMSECFDAAALRRAVDKGLATDRDGAGESRYRATNVLWGLLVLAAWSQRLGIEP